MVVDSCDLIIPTSDVHSKVVPTMCWERVRHMENECLERTDNLRRRGTKIREERGLQYEER